MKANGFNIELIRGESAALQINLITYDGRPFRLLTDDLFAFLNLRFRVKENPYQATESIYVIDKLLPLDTSKRFSDIEIIDISQYKVGVYHYDSTQFDSTYPPDSGDINRLFYHPVVDEYRYWDADITQWVIYDTTVVIPLAPADTLNLAYKKYVYDVVLEAGSEESVVEYVQVIIDQHDFVISYKV